MHILKILFKFFRTFKSIDTQNQIGEMIEEPNPPIVNSAAFQTPKTVLSPINCINSSECKIMYSIEVFKLSNTPSVTRRDQNK